MKVLLLTALLCLAPVSLAHAEQVAVTCELNAHDIEITKRRIVDLQHKFTKSTDEREKMILGFEGQMMINVLESIQGWRKKNCQDI